MPEGGLGANNVASVTLHVGGAGILKRCNYLQVDKPRNSDTWGGRGSPVVLIN